MDEVIEKWCRLHNFHLYTGSYQTKDLANYLKISPRTIQRWLKGKVMPDQEQLTQISKYLYEKDQKIAP